MSCLPANCIVIWVLILSVYSTLVPIVTLTGYGTLGYSCALMSELKIRKVKKKYGRWQELCQWRSHFLFSYLISKLLGYKGCLSIPMTWERTRSCGEARTGNSDSYILFPGAQRGHQVTCDKSVKRQNPNFSICEMDIKAANLMIVNCLIFRWEPVCSSDPEKTLGLWCRLTSFLFLALELTQWETCRNQLIWLFASMHSMIKMRIIKSYLY